MRNSAAVILISLSVGACSDTCRNDVVSTAEAPTGTLRAVLFQRDCGSTTGFSSQVSLTEGTRSPSGGGNVFIADTDHGAAKSAPWGGPWVELRWLSPDDLLIRYDGKARVFTQSGSTLGVNITYEKVAR
jgi:hypothetical protein